MFVDTAVREKRNVKETLRNPISNTYTDQTYPTLGLKKKILAELMTLALVVELRWIGCWASSLPTPVEKTAFMKSAHSELASVVTTPKFSKWVSLNENKPRCLILKHISFRGAANRI